MLTAHLQQQLRHALGCVCCGGTLYRRLLLLLLLLLLLGLLLPLMLPLPLLLLLSRLLGLSFLHGALQGGRHTRHGRLRFRQYLAARLRLQLPLILGSMYMAFQYLTFDVPSRNIAGGDVISHFRNVLAFAGVLWAAAPSPSNDLQSNGCDAPTCCHNSGQPDGRRCSAGRGARRSSRSSTSHRPATMSGRLLAAAGTIVTAADLRTCRQQVSKVLPTCKDVFRSAQHVQCGPAVVCVFMQCATCR